MGQNFTWIACPRAAEARMHATLGVRVEDTTLDGRPRTGAAALTTPGWSVLFDPKLVYFMDPEMLAGLSKGVGSLLWFIVSDRVMISALTSFVDGAQQWCVRNEGGARFIEGAVPEQVQAFLAGRPTYEAVEALAEHLTSVPPAVDHGFRAATLPRPVEVLDLTRKKKVDGKLAQLAGWSCLKRVTLVSSDVTDAGLAHLRNHTGLERLDLRHTRITDAGLAGLLPLEGLEVLDVAGTAVTSATFAALGKQTKLRSLSVSGTPFGDADLAVVAALPTLKDLSLYGTRVTDAGLLALADHPNLSRLGLGTTAITDAAMATFLRIPKLDALFLNDTQVTDAGIATLVQHPVVAQLGLEGTTITDASLARLSTRFHRWLGVARTGVTEAGVQAFRAVRRASCHVEV